MDTFKPVTRHEPCVLCGKPDNCSIRIPASQKVPDEILQVCRRANPVNTISPINGKTYIFIQEQSDGSCLFKEEELKNRCIDAWKIEKNLTKKGSKNKEKAQAVEYKAKSKQLVQPEKSQLALPNYKLDIIYRKFISILKLEKVHSKKLFEEGWTKDMILGSNIKSMPLAEFSGQNRISVSQIKKRICNTLIKSLDFDSLQGAPGFYQDKYDDKWTFFGSSGILIPVYDLNSHMYRLRLRLDNPPVDDNGKELGKYYNFSSYYVNDGDIQNIYHNGTQSGSPIGLYYKEKTDDSKVAYVTEGEKKGIYSNYILKNPIISLPGVSTFKKLIDTVGDISYLRYLEDIGCRVIVIAYDADKKFNKNVLKAEKNLINFLLEHWNYDIAIADWNIGFGKGLDDMLSMHVRPNLTYVRQNTLR